MCFCVDFLVPFSSLECVLAVLSPEHHQRTKKKLFFFLIK